MNINFIKTHKFCMICIGIFILLILLNLLFGSSSPIPYYPDNIFAKQFPYTREGMNGESNNDPDLNPNKDEKEEEGYSEEKEEEEEGYSEEKEEGYSEKKEGYKGNIKLKKKSKKEGFQGLPSGTFNNEQYIGYLANVKTGGNCGSTSNGYSTSTGYICLSPNELHYLQSRGGNATAKGDF